MSVTITVDKVLQIMDIMRRNPNTMRPVPSTKKRDTSPVRMIAFQDVVASKTPLVYVVQIGNRDHRLHLSDGYADSESPGAPIVGQYNAVLKALGNKAVLDEHAPFSEVCKAHKAIYARVTQKDLPMPEDTRLVSAKAQPSKADVKQQSHLAAKAAPTPKEAKPVVTTENTKAVQEPLVRPYVWVKNGREERITVKQWEQRVRMCGGLDRVPVGSGEVGDPFEMPVLLKDGDVPEIEWHEDIPYVVAIHPASEPLVTVVQQPKAEAPAKRSKAAVVKVEHDMDLSEALAILSR